MPFFSVIIPSFNRANKLETVIDSLSHQHFKDFEALVIDDGSTDQTPALMDALLKKFPFLRYHQQENKGVCSARNAGARLADGQYLLFLDSDDWVAPGWLSDFYEISQRFSFDVIFCNMKEIREGGKIHCVDASDPYRSLNKKTTQNTDPHQQANKKGKFIAGMFAVKNDVFLKAGMYDEHIKYGENTELGIRLRNMHVSMGFVPNYNFVYHVLNGSESKNNTNKLASNVYMVDKHRDYFEKNPLTKKLFLQVAAVAAARLGDCHQAHALFKNILRAHPTDIKVWLQFLITLSPTLTAWKWKRQQQ